MDLDEIREALRSTLDDRRLSRSERRALRELLSTQSLGAAERDVLRAHVFSLAQAALEGSQAQEVLRWVQEAVGLLQPVAEPRGRAEAWFGPGEAPLHALLREIEATSKTLEVCIFTLTDDRVARALLSAHARRVRLRVLTDDDKSEDLGSDAHRLAQAGVPVRYDAAPGHMHHKFALFDGQRLVTGSYNWTRSAAQDNHENLVLSTDARLVGAFASEFEVIWAAAEPSGRAIH